MKKAISLRIDEEVLNLLDIVSENTRYNRTFIIEECILFISCASQEQTSRVADLTKHPYYWRQIVDGFKTANTKER